MSGFFGIARTDGGDVDPGVLRRAEEKLRFRGPEGTHITSRQALAACFARMDKPDATEHPLLPIWLQDRYAILGDVRLDAREEIAEELKREGRLPMQDVADEELVLRAWATWGEESLTRLLGDYSFALWDAIEQTLWCARDFIGARPFFYALGKDAIAFGNTLDTLREVPWVSAQLDEVFIADFLLDGRCADWERSIWKDVRRLPPGHRLRFAKGQAHIERFQRLPVEEPLAFADPAEYTEAYREVLMRAVRSRLPTGKTSLYLSGGLDSASVCATAVRLAGPEQVAQSLRAFTISWRPLVDDEEAEFARQTAEHLKLPHEVLGEEETWPYDGTALADSPEPTCEVFTDRALRQYAKIAAHSRVVLGGDGGDDVLTGQSWPYLRFLWQRGQWATLARSFGGYLGEHRKLPPLGTGIAGKVKRWFRGEENANLPTWFRSDFAERVRNAREASTKPSDSLETHPVHSAAYKGLHSGYWARILESDDAGFTRVLLETRAPLLDLRVLRFLLRLPPVPWCMEKKLARESLREFLPPGVLNRRKSPLPEDPLLACQRRFGWQPSPPAPPPQILEKFVQWSCWLATLEKSRGSHSWESLYPMSLAIWLKAIEKG